MSPSCIDYINQKTNTKCNQIQDCLKHISENFFMEEQLTEFNYEAETLVSIKQTQTKPPKDDER